jgi:hypothetical protein
MSDTDDEIPPDAVPLGPPDVPPDWLQGVLSRAYTHWMSVFAVFERASKGLELLTDIREPSDTDGTSERSLLLSQGLVALYSGFEALVRDTLILWLANTPSAWQVKRVAEMQVPVSEWMGKDTHTQAAYVIDKLWYASKGLRPLSRFESLFEQFGITKVEKPDTSALLVDAALIPRYITELWALRNAIVHNVGVADAQFCAACPHLPYRVGEPFVISEDDLLHYSQATMGYLFLLTQRLRIAHNRVMGLSDE